MNLETLLAYALQFVGTKYFWTSEDYSLGGDTV